MDVGSIASVASALALARTADAVQMAVHKKAIDIEQQLAMQLIQAVAQSAPGNPPNLGNHVDIYA
jgi:hypothetical protein